MAKKTIGADGEQSARKSGIATNPIRNLLIISLVCAALGAAFLLEPGFVRNYCGYIIGGLICASGLVYVLIYFLRKPVGGVYRTEFATGMMILAAGAYVMLTSIRPDTTGITLSLRLTVTAIGVVIAADGILKLQYALDLARMKFGGWWLAFIMSLLGIALGVLIAMGLFDSFGVQMNIGSTRFFSAMMALGIGFCANAVLDLITVIVIAVRNRKGAKAAAAAEAEAAAVVVPVSPYAPAPETPAID